MKYDFNPLTGFMALVIAVAIGTIIYFCSSEEQKILVYDRTGNPTRIYFDSGYHLQDYSKDIKEDGTYVITLNFKQEKEKQQ